MVRLIQRSRVKNQEEFDRLFRACVSSPQRKIINKGLVIDSSFMMLAYSRSLGTIGDFNHQVAMQNYSSEYPYTVLVND